MFDFLELWHFIAPPSTCEFDSGQLPQAEIDVPCDRLRLVLGCMPVDVACEVLKVKEWKRRGCEALVDCRSHDHRARKAIKEAHLRDTSRTCSMVERT